MDFGGLCLVCVSLVSRAVFGLPIGLFVCSFVCLREALRCFAARVALRSGPSGLHTPTRCRVLTAFASSSLDVPVLCPVSFSAFYGCVLVQRRDETGRDFERTVGVLHW